MSSLVHSEEEINKERKTDRKKEKRREEKVRRNVAVIKNLTNNNFKEQKV